MSEFAIGYPEFEKEGIFMDKVRNVMDMNGEDAIWLTDLLRESSDYFAFQEDSSDRVSSDFRERCREAAAGALTLSQLRNERQRIGFVPLSLETYVQGLVKVTNVSLGPIL